MDTASRIDEHVVATSLHDWVVADHGALVMRLIVVMSEHVGATGALVVRLVCCHVVVWLLIMVMQLLLEMVADAQRAISPIVNACSCLMKRGVILDLIAS